jgi:hypothetical protein
VRLPTGAAHLAGRFGGSPLAAYASTAALLILVAVPMRTRLSRPRSNSFQTNASEHTSMTAACGTVTSNCSGATSGGAALGGLRRGRVGVLAVGKGGPLVVCACRLYAAPLPPCAHLAAQRYASPKYVGPNVVHCKCNHRAGIQNLAKCTTNAPWPFLAGCKSGVSPGGPCRTRTGGPLRVIQIQRAL